MFVVVVAAVVVGISKIVSSKTESHLFIVKLDDKNLTGKDVEAWLAGIGLLVNKNTIPGDKQSPFVTSGIRIGTCAITTRGLAAKQAKELALLMVEAIDNIGNKESQANIAAQVKSLTKQHPLYSNLVEA